MDRTPADLERAAAAAGAVLLSHELVQRKDGSWTLCGRFGFEDPWAAARLLSILAEEDADDPAVQAWGRSILEETAAAYGTTPDDPTIVDAFAAAVHANVKRWIRFAPEEGERFQSADTTMIEGVGDCDCQARLAHALVRSQGGASEIRYFDAGGEPVHACCAFATSYGPAWAETTIAALFGEHPQDAYRRLGLDQQSARPDIGFLGIEFVTPGNVTARKAELNQAVIATDADVRRCTTLDPATGAAWTTFVVGWRAFMDDTPGWWDAGAQGRQAAEYADRITEWQNKLATLCTLSAPILPKVPEDPTVSLLKWTAVAVAVVAGAVVAAKIVDVVKPARTA